MFLARDCGFTRSQIFDVELIDVPDEEGNDLLVKPLNNVRCVFVSVVSADRLCSDCVVDKWSACARAEVRTRAMRYK
jgi:hypothetical protein